MNLLIDGICNSVLTKSQCHNYSYYHKLLTKRKKKKNLQPRLQNAGNEAAFSFSKRIVENVGTYHVHTSYSISSIFSLYNRFVVRRKPVSEFLLQLSGNKLSLPEVMVPGVITITKNYITELHLEKMEETSISLLFWSSQTVNDLHPVRNRNVKIVRKRFLLCYSSINVQQAPPMFAHGTSEGEKFQLFRRK